MDNHTFTDSSAISRFKFNPETRQLDVVFKSGRAYSFYGVAPEMVDDFRSAESAGKFFNENLKGHFGESHESG